jgi:ureidoacrylate peracid hydrolase
MVLLNTKPKPLAIDFASTALLVIDMQHAFLSKGGTLDLAGLDVAGSERAIEVNRRLLDACRAAHIKVVYLQMAFKADLSDIGEPSAPFYHKELAVGLMRDRPQLAGKLLVEDTWDSAIVDELSPQPGDHVILKARFDGFYRTGLDDYLKAHNIRYLLVTGVGTNVCVESTVRNAYFHDFWPILIEDAVHTSSPDFVRQATLWNVEHIFGWVTQSKDVLAIL